MEDKCKIIARTGTEVGDKHKIMRPEDPGSVLETRQASGRQVWHHAARAPEHIADKEDNEDKGDKCEIMQPKQPQCG